MFVFNSYSNIIFPHRRVLTSMFIRNIRISSVKKHVKLNIEPKTCLQDEEIRITANGLKPGQHVTLTSSLKDDRNRGFFSYSHYIANSDGNLDLNENASLGGSYSGLFPMGPIAGMQPSPAETKYIRYVKRDVQNSDKILFSISNGHQNEQNALQSESEATAEHFRNFMAPGVERIPVKVGRIRGTLFIPPGEGPFPGVIDLFGSTGGLIEFRAAQLASRGIAALALAYFGYDDLPKTMSEKDLSYFEEAALFLREHKKVMKPHVGAIGVSMGGELACAMGTYISFIKAVVCINAYPVNTWSPLIVNGKKMPYVEFRMEKGKFVPPGLINCIEMLDDTTKFPETHFPLHESDADFLFHAALDDQNYRTEEAVDQAEERMLKNNYTRFKVLKYPDAGHLLEPPFSPVCFASSFKSADVVLCWGGSMIPHSDASVTAWRETINFIKEKIRPV